MSAPNPRAVGRPSAHTIGLVPTEETVCGRDGPVPAPASSRRAICVWVTMAAVAISFWVSLLTYVPIEQTCEITSRLLHVDSATLNATELLVVAIISTLVTGFFAALVLADTTRYVAGSQGQLMAKINTHTSFALVLIMAVDVVFSCSSWNLTSEMGMLVGVLQLVFLFVNLSTVIWCSMGRLRSLAAVAPIAVVRIGEMTGCCAFAMLILSVVVTVIFPDMESRVLRYTIQGFGFSGLFGTVLFFGIVALVLVFSANSALNEASHADVDHEFACKLRGAARWARFAAVLTAMCGITCVIVPCLRLIGSFDWEADFFFLLYRYFATFTIVLNMVASVALSGMLGAEQRSSLHMHVAAVSAHARRRRQIQSRLSQTIGASTGPALTIAALMEGANPEEILRKAVSRFRCVSWETLSQRPEIIIAGGLLDGASPIGNDLYSLSQPCQFGDCDGFFSHSWRDNGEQKWEALRSWCERFVRLEGRYPRLWLDKVCLNQIDIATDLQCLPIFLAACNTIIVACGPTFPSRLWCCMELLIYRAMLASDCSRRLPELLLLDDSSEHLEQQRQTWATFCVGNCDCFRKEDKRRFLRVVDQFPGGSEGFDKSVRAMLADLLPSPKDEYNFCERI